MGFRRFDNLDYRGFDNLDFMGFNLTPSQDKALTDACRKKVMNMESEGERESAFKECLAYGEAHPNEIPGIANKKFDWEKAGVAGGNVLDFLTGLFGSRPPAIGGGPIDYNISMGIQSEEDKKRKLKNGLLIGGVLIIGALVTYKILTRKAVKA